MTGTGHFHRGAPASRSRAGAPDGRPERNGGWCRHQPPLSQLAPHHDGAASRWAGGSRPGAGPAGHLVRSGARRARRLVRPSGHLPGRGPSGFPPGRGGARRLRRFPCRIAAAAEAAAGPVSAAATRKPKLERRRDPGRVRFRGRFPFPSRGRRKSSLGEHWDLPGRLMRCRTRFEGRGPFPHVRLRFAALPSPRFAFLPGEAHEARLRRAAVRPEASFPPLHLAGDREDAVTLSDSDQADSPCG